MPSGLFLLQAQALGPEACILSGLCAAPEAGSPIPSGLMFTAVGLVGLGVWRWRRLRGRPTPPGGASPAA